MTDQVMQVALGVLSSTIVPALIAATWRLAVVYRVTSTGYTYRTKGRWGETEITPAAQDIRSRTG